jgi:NADH-quinone oxidoreductase subunit J
MNLVFYIAAAVAVVSTTMVILQAQAVHALLYLIVSLLAVALVLFVLGAPLVAAVEVIVYAGAILVLFLFVVMMLNVAPGRHTVGRGWLAPRNWALPTLLVAVLLGQLLFVLSGGGPTRSPGPAIAPRAVGVTLFAQYLLGVELSALLLLSAMVGAYHLGRRDRVSMLTSAEPRRTAEQNKAAEFAGRVTESAEAVPPHGNGHAAGEASDLPPLPGGVKHGQRTA